MGLVDTVFRVAGILDEVRRFDVRISLYRPYGRRKPALGPRRRWHAS
jgi:hypothetical protein